jgi:hypothetical protein
LTAGLPDRLQAAVDYNQKLCQYKLEHQLIVLLQALAAKIEAVNAHAHCCLHVLIMPVHAYMYFAAAGCLALDLCGLHDLGLHTLGYMIFGSI